MGTSDSSPDHSFGISTQLAQIRADERILEMDISQLKQTVGTLVASTSHQYKSLEDSIAAVRDLARDSLHVATGVDGKNGLRGTLLSLSDKLDKLTQDVQAQTQKHSHDLIKLNQFVQEQNDRRNNLSGWLKLVFGCFGAQVAAFLIWSGKQTAQQDVLRADVTKLVETVERIKEGYKLPAKVTQ